MSESIILAALKVDIDTRYSFAAAIVFLLCDICSKFDDEITHIWKARWTPAKILYILARYYGLIAAICVFAASLVPNPSVKFCHGYTKLSSLAGTRVCNLIVDLICILRIHALYNRNRKVLIFLLILLCGEAGAGIYLSNIQTTFPMPPQPLPFHFAAAPCFGTKSVTPEMLRLLPLSWALNILLASTFFFMTIFKLKDSLRDSKGRIRYEVLKDWSFVHPLLSVLVVDGAFAFLMVVGILGFSAFMSIFRGGFYYTPAWPWLYAVYSHAGSILILNLRRVGGSGTPTSIVSPRAPRGGGAGDRLELTRLSDIQFESHTMIARKDRELGEDTELETEGHDDGSYYRQSSRSNVRF